MICPNMTRPNRIDASTIHPKDRPSIFQAAIRLPVLFCMLLSGAPAAATPCATEDHITRVSGEAQCLQMRRYGHPQPRVMLVWLHGDLSSGGPASYHFALAEQSAAALQAEQVLAVALVRPGYDDGEGRASTVAFRHSGRNDHYTRVNLNEVGAAIERLRQHYQPQSVILVGHSGGAATAAVLLGLRPGLAQGAVLVACPCDLVAWREGRRPWSQSENPLDWAARVAPDTRVIAITGARDDNTAPALAQAYVERLAARNLRASFRLLPEAGHNNALRAPEVLQAIIDLIRT